LLDIYQNIITMHGPMNVKYCTLCICLRREPDLLLTDFMEFIALCCDKLILFLIKKTLFLNAMNKLLLVCHGTTG